jgi:D-alanyl-D-alanine carboxypeptidase
MRFDNHFRIGSNTKGFTGTVILKLVDEGKLTLDQKVSTLLDGVPNGENITVRQLLNMTSGLVNYSETDAFNVILRSDTAHRYKRDELLGFAFAKPNEFDPGTKWEYSNTNTVLLGKIIEKLTGRSVAQAFAQYLFRPLGMRNTSWPTSSAMPRPYAHGYTDDTNGRKVVDATNWNPTWADAAGQLVSNVYDMEKWARALGTGSLISPAMQRERLTWVKDIPDARGTYGLAIGRAGNWLHHQGELPGYNTIAAYLPAKDATCVVLVNSNVPFDKPGPASKLMMAISNVVSPEDSPGR